MIQHVQKHSPSNCISNNTQESLRVFKCHLFNHISSMIQWAVKR